MLSCAFSAENELAYELSRGRIKVSLLRRSSTSYLNEENHMEHNNWQCPKCHNKQFETDQFAATGGGLTKFFNIQSKRFTTSPPHAAPSVRRSEDARRQREAWPRQRTIQPDRLLVGGVGHPEALVCLRPPSHPSETRESARTNCSEEKIITSRRVLTADSPIRARRQRHPSRACRLRREWGGPVRGHPQRGYETPSSSEGRMHTQKV